MALSYTWLWFDADDTLFDYKRAEAAALELTFQGTGLAFRPEYLPAYQRYNQELWRELELGTVSPVRLRTLRFERLFAEFGLELPVEEFSTAYLKNLANSSILNPGAETVVRTLSKRYRIGVLTNGLKDVQRPRLVKSAIWDCLSGLVISEEVGAAKPAPEYFAIAFQQMGNPPLRSVLMIGDNLNSDIRGASRYDLDTCWYNPARLPRPADLSITYEIHDLLALIPLLA
jgi:2-haloacid dehalogenase